MPPSTDTVLDVLVAGIGAAIDDAVVLRDRLRAVPERAHEEVETAAAIEGRLGQPTARFAGTGLMFAVGETTGGIVVRAELDAVELQAGPAHACGHDVHMAALVALVEAARAAGSLPAPLWAVFQPSEEAYPSGAEALVRTGIVSTARASVACHVHPDIQWRTLAISAGDVNAACDNFEIRVTGAGGHAAYRHRSADPVLALADIVTTLHAVLPRRVDPLRSAVVAVGELHAGSSPSVIPTVARATGTLRTFTDADRHALADGVRTVTERVAAAHGCGSAVTITPGEPVLSNDGRLVDAALARAPAAGLRPQTGWRSCGADDFAFLGSVAPLTMAYLGLEGAPDFTPYPLHHSQFRPPDPAVREVAVALAVLYAAAAATTETTTLE